MKKTKRWRIIISIISLVMFGLIAGLYTRALEESLTVGNKMHMQESTANVARLIEQKTRSNFEILRTARTYVYDFEDFKDDRKIEILDSVCQQNAFFRLGYADVNGDSITSDGKHINIAGEKYFKDAVKGMNGISQVILSEEQYLGNYNIYSIPVVRKNKVEAVLYGAYETKNIYDTRKFEFSNKNADVYIADDSGQIIENSKPFIIKKDLFSTLKISENKDFIEKLGQNFDKNEMGVFKYTNDDGEKKYISYATISPRRGNSELKVVTVVSDDTGFEKSNEILMDTMQLMFLITFMFALVLFGILYSKEMNQKRLEKVAYYDDLCDVKNQNGFVKVAGEILKKKKEKMVFAYIDIDNFKAINSIFSYQYGNEVLKQLAKILEEIFGEKALVGRFSGDNFAVLSYYEEEDDIINKINVLEEMANKRCHNEKELMLAVGIYFVKEDDEEFNRIFDKANIAKHSVKHLNKSRYSIYDEEIGKLMQENDMLTEEIKKAIKQRDFEVYYQPKFDFSTKQIMASEALIRWNHKEKGFISPAKFIPIAEQTHLIVDIGHFVFDRVCADIQNWISMGIKPFPVSVNFSRVEILQGDMIEFIERTVKKYNTSYNLLEIEITETIAVSDYEKIENTLNEIKRLGMTISIDDFGAGYSSLGCLQKLHVDTLKIDRSFILDLENNKRGNNILKGMIDLSKKLELKTICEGIETEEQMKVLEMLDCDYGQGFIFAHPMKESEFREKLLR